MTSNSTPEIRLSLIVPVYNRPNEVDELLDSLQKQTNPNFEIVIVEDGSTLKCDDVVERYVSTLNIHYFYKNNSGPGLSRNYGCERSHGNYFVVLDSDCIIPPHYVQTVLDYLARHYVDAFGGPDMAHDSFTRIQKAINYSMTSFFTTGGIRGGGEKLDTFYPRSFNMGYSKAVFETTKGFSGMRFGEDIDLSIRILANGFRTALIKDAYVYHKRRTRLRQFFKQVFNSGIARINLYKRHPGTNSLKAVHFFPSLFMLGNLFLLLMGILVSPWFLLPLGVYALLVAVDSSLKNTSIAIGLLSVVTSYYQLVGYGSGFIKAFWKRILFSDHEFAAFQENFYK